MGHLCGIFEKCNVTLPGLPADVEPGQTISDLRVQVSCPNRSPAGIFILLKPDVIDFSGGHQHSAGRKPDFIGEVVTTGASGNITDLNGEISYFFTAPSTAGDHTVTATCEPPVDCETAVGQLWVGIRGLVNIPPSGYWNLYGNTGIHPAGHYLTPAALGKLSELAQLYTQVYFPLNTPVLQLNDASLERGGVFDIDKVGRSTFWTPPHAEHQRGVVIDIQANGTATAIPEVNFTDFEDLLTSLGMNWWPENLNQSGGHYHVRLLGVAQ